MASNPNREIVFRFKQFEVKNGLSAMKVGTDAVLLGALAGRHKKNVSRILDVGAGSGVVSLMLAQRFAQAEVVAIEIDDEAAFEAQVNFDNSKWKNRMFVKCADFNEIYSELGTYDLIVSNPPYFKNGLRSPEKSRAVARHSDTLSYSDILNKGRQMLHEDGSIVIVGPIDQLCEIMFESVLCRFEVVSEIQISTVEGKPPTRFVIEFSLKPHNTEKRIISISTANRSFSPEYVDLTKVFYLNF